MRTPTTPRTEPSDFERWHDGTDDTPSRLAGLHGEERTRAIVAALDQAQWFEGLGEALDLAAEHPSPAVVDALWRNLQARGGDVAVHCAALLTFLHGLPAEPFDLAQRPFFLRFNTDDARERATVIDELRVRIEQGVR